MTLPALPLFTYALNLPDNHALRLALYWMRGGDIFDYLKLDLPDSVLISMILQAAQEARIRKVSAKQLRPSCEALQNISMEWLTAWILAGRLQAEVNQ
jgi:hypothetical protein